VTKRSLFSCGVILLAVCSSVCCAQIKNEARATPARSIAELRQQLETILAGTHTPGLSVAIVHKDRQEWVAGLGKSDVATNHSTTDETLFRIGSVAKAFASLAILKLVNEGKLSLQDTVRTLAPEVWFENRWEATDPVRVVDLLEHTTGWDDMHPAEYAKDANGMSLRDGLDYYRMSRISRWRPGTRMSYCNSGPPVAAYIVEKITGRRFEDYVTENFFLPIGMKTATYFEQPPPQLTTLYEPDGKTPSPYWNLLLRPAGSINASARDMAAYVQFYLNRGAVGGNQVMPAASIERMETPSRTWEAQEGLTAGYGLGNFVSVHDGFIYHGHTGGVHGGLTDMAYMPEHDVGYFYSINAGNDGAVRQVGDVIRAYLTRGLTRAQVPPAGQLATNAHEYAGWYVPDAPRYEMIRFVSNLVAMRRVRFGGGNLLLTDLGHIDQPFVPVSGAQFRYVPKNDRAEPIATATLLTPNAEGRFVFLGGPLGGTMKRMPAGLAMAQMALTGWFVLAIVGILLYAPCWIVGGLITKRRRPAERAMRVWPLVAALSLLASLAILALAGSNPWAHLGHLTVWSVSLFLATLSFGVAAVASAVALWLARKRQIRRFVRWHSMAVTPALLIAAVYLAYWGVIGIRTWK
jgi:CubicO group peptidase (beta-lactamase class C family)